MQILYRSEIQIVPIEYLLSEFWDRYSIKSTSVLSKIKSWNWLLNPVNFHFSVKLYPCDLVDYVVWTDICGPPLVLVTSTWQKASIIGWRGGEKFSDISCRWRRALSHSGPLSLSFLLVLSFISYFISIIFTQQPHSRDQRDLRYEGISNPCSWGCVTPSLYFSESESLVYDFLGKNLYLQNGDVFVFWGLQQQLNEHSTLQKA